MELDQYSETGAEHYANVGIHEFAAEIDGNGGCNAGLPWLRSHVAAGKLFEAIPRQADSIECKSLNSNSEEAALNLAILMHILQDACCGPHVLTYRAQTTEENPLADKGLNSVYSLRRKRTFHYDK
jgi:hypothetical protein